MRLRWKTLFAVLIGFVIVSIGLNLFLFDLALEYYRDASAVRLDPLSLDVFPNAPSNSDAMRVVFFGDSRAQDWPVPAEFVGVEFLNRGIGNQTSTQIALRFDAHVRPLSPDVIVLQMCVNDLKAIPLFPERKDAIIATCQSNIERIIAESREIGVQVILTTVFPVGDVPLQRRFVWSGDVAEAVREVNQYIMSLAADDVIVFDTYSLLVDDDNGLLRPDLSLDELHLNTEGYAVLNSELAEIISQMGGWGFDGTDQNLRAEVASRQL